MVSSGAGLMNVSSIDNVVDLCQALVQIPSENPSGSPASRGEQAIAQFVGEFLESLGAEVEFEEIGPGRPNVYGLWPVPPGTNQRILFAPHLDTVTVDGMIIEPYCKIETYILKKDNKAFSRFLILMFF